MTFLIIGDMGTSDHYQLLVAKSMEKLIKNYKVKFICGLGDNIYEFGVKSVTDIKFKKHFEEPYKNINLKFYMCLGNHDYGEIINNVIPKDYKHQIDYTKISKKWHLPQRYYTYSKKMNGIQVDFFVLDTNIDLMEDNEIMDQLLFFKKAIKKSKGRWKILYGHHTYRSVSGHGNAEPLLENFLNALFSLGKIDIYMCGHDHTKQYIQKQLKFNNNNNNNNNNNKKTLNKNNKILHIIVCGSGGKPYDYVTNLKNMNDCDLIFSSTNLGVGLINCKRNITNISFFNEKNELEYKYSIQK